MLFLGIDPDLHNTGLAVVDVDPNGSKRAHWVGVARVAKALKGEDAVVAMASALDEASRGILRAHKDASGFFWEHSVVEGQEIYQGSEVRVSDLLNLAQVAGAAAGVFGAGRIPRPKDWKGNVPKHIHQARTARALGWACEVRGGKEPYVVPQLSGEVRGADDLEGRDWKHVMDAIGLALWASKTFLTWKGRAA